MRSTYLLAMGGMAMGGAALTTTTSKLPSTAPIACKYFKANYPNMTLLPSDAGYTAENEGMLLLRESHYQHDPDHML